MLNYYNKGYLILSCFTFKPNIRSLWPINKYWAVHKKSVFFLSYIYIDSQPCLFSSFFYFTITMIRVLYTNHQFQHSDVIGDWHIKLVNEVILKITLCCLNIEIYFTANVQCPGLCVFTYRFKPKSCINCQQHSSTAYSHAIYFKIKLYFVIEYLLVQNEILNPEPTQSYQWTSISTKQRLSCPYEFQHVINNY